MTTVFLVLVLSYLLGSIPTSIVVGRIGAGLDIREHGSGNAGATNVYRLMGLGPAILVGLVDVAKGSIAVVVISTLQVDPELQLSTDMLKILAGGAAVAGHIWTVFGGFRGGKGMATAIGALAFIAPVALGAALVVWLILLFTTRIMSLASLSAAII
ncbi:glycerol-3-phosphate acyltransferase, partial [Gemmatimonadota bacterium]